MTVGIFGGNDGRYEVDAGIAGCCARASHVSFEEERKKNMRPGRLSSGFI